MSIDKPTLVQLGIVQEFLEALKEGVKLAEIKKLLEKESLYGWLTRSLGCGEGSNYLRHLAQGRKAKLIQAHLRVALVAIGLFAYMGLVLAEGWCKN